MGTKDDFLMILNRFKKKKVALKLTHIDLCTVIQRNLRSGQFLQSETKIEPDLRLIQRG